MEINKIKFKSTYRYFNVFSVDKPIFEYPGRLIVELKNDENVFTGGKLKIIGKYQTETIGSYRSGGLDCFNKEIEIPLQKSKKKKSYNIQCDTIPLLRGIFYSVILTITLYNHEGKSVYSKKHNLEIKSKEENNKEIRNKLIFLIVILTFLITIFNVFIKK